MSLAVHFHGTGTPEKPFLCENMAGMGGIYQVLDILGVALAIFAALLLAAFLIGLLFQNKKTRKRIIIGTIALYLLALVSYFGYIAFILSGNLN